MILRLKYIHKVKGRNGAVHYYLRRKGLRAVSLPDMRDPGFLAAYQAALAETERKPILALPHTLEGLIEAWSRSAHFASLSPATQTTYRRIMLDLQKQDYAAGMVAEFEPVHIRRIMARHSDTPAAANNRLKILRLAFDHAVDDGWRQDNPAKTVKKYREKAEGATPWKEEQITQFLDHWPIGTLPRLALLLLLYSGQRRSDVVRMGRQHVRGDLLEVTQQKTGAALMIPLHSTLAQELQHAPQEGTFLQTGKGEAFTANGFYMRFKSWRSSAGLPDGLSPHGLRKAAARRLAEAGCSAHQIAAITGHATLSEVERYTRAADQERLARAAMAMIEVESKTGKV